MPFGTCMLFLIDTIDHFLTNRPNGFKSPVLIFFNLNVREIDPPSDIKLLEDQSRKLWVNKKVNALKNPS